MSIARAVLVAAQAALYQLASTPPNKTPPKGRFDGDHPLYIRIAPVIMKVQQPLIWLCAGAELLLLFDRYGLLPLSPSSSHTFHRTICPPTSTPNIHVSAPALLGIALVVFGSLLRLTCFQKLGALFTFDLTIFPAHSLITSGPYAYVRHPAYTGTLSMSFGMAFINLTAGSWVAECEVLGHGLPSAALRLLGATAWMAWWFAVGFTRCRAEDAELRKKFGTEWEVYAKQVQAWFVPGLL